VSIADESPQDRAGCAWFAVRFLGCSALLYILMFVAILLAGLIGVLFFGRQH
jgi:hypothetical protein